MNFLKSVEETISEIPMTVLACVLAFSLGICLTSVVAIQYIPTTQSREMRCVKASTGNGMMLCKLQVEVAK